MNNNGYTPLQLAALKCHIPSLELLFKHHADPLIKDSKEQSILHLACFSTLYKILQVKDDLKSDLESEHENNCIGTCSDIEKLAKIREQDIQNDAFPCLELILEKFKKHPDILEIEDTLETSPGGILHYFSYLNFVEGVKILMQEPFLIRYYT